MALEWGLFFPSYFLVYIRYWRNRMRCIQTNRILCASCARTSARVCVCKRAVSAQLLWLLVYMFTVQFTIVPQRMSNKKNICDTIQQTHTQSNFVLFYTAKQQRGWVAWLAIYINRSELGLVVWLALDFDVKRHRTFSRASTICVGIARWDSVESVGGAQFRMNGCNKPRMNNIWARNLEIDYDLSSRRWYYDLSSPTRRFAHLEGNFHD